MTQFPSVSEAPSDEPPSKDKSALSAYFSRPANQMAAFVLILIVALLLRLFRLGHQSLWLDEIASWAISSRDLHRVLKSEPTNPPIYYLLLHFWMKAFGTSEWAIRSLNVLPSVFSVWLVYRLAERLFNRGVAFVSAAYMAVSTFQIYYAQEARCFTLLTVLLLSATICLWNALESTSPRRRYSYYGAYSLLGALSLYTHFIAIFFLAAHGLYVLFRRPKQVWAAGVSIAGSLLLFFPWLLTMLRVAGHVQQARRYLPLKLPQAYFTFLYGYSLIPMDDRAVRHIVKTLEANAWLLGASILCLALLLSFWRLAWKQWREPMALVLVMATIPVLMAFFVSFKVVMFSERYLIAASPFIYIAVAASIEEFWTRRRAPGNRPFSIYAGWAACGLFCVLLAVSLFNYYFNPRFSKEQWRQADAYINASLQPGQKTLMVFDPDYLLVCYRYYGKRTLPAWQITAPVEAQLAASDSLVEQHAQGYQDIILIRSHDPADTVVNAMREAFPQESYRKFSDANPIEVYSFRVSKH
jgi:mannosyltransferase